MLERRYRLLWQLAKGLHRTQAKTLVMMARGLIGWGQMRSFALAGALARATEVRFKSALKRFYRWVHGDKLDDLACWSALAGRVLTHAGRRPLVAVDWTEWHSGLRVLGAAVCVGSRAVPVRVQAFSKTDIPRSQNTRENTFVKLLVRLSAHMQGAGLIFDRGFRRISLIRELSWLSQPFLIRLAAKVQVVSESYTGLLSQHPLRPGQRVDLGMCALGQTKPVRVRVIGVWARGQEEPWWLATTLRGSARRVAVYSDRRMGIEEHFRDSKGCRYGTKIKWTAFTDAAAVARLFLLAAIACAVWCLAGVLACRSDPSLRLAGGRKGPRRSLVAVGIDSPEAIAQILASSWARLGNLWPEARLRNFAW
jgi:hypothetical protein